MSSMIDPLDGRGDARHRASDSDSEEFDADLEDLAALQAHGDDNVISN